MEKRFNIEVSEKQLFILKTMSDTMARLICGQLDVSLQEAAEHAWERDHKTPKHPSGVCAEGWFEMREQVEEHIKALRELCWNKRGSEQYGIHYDDTADILYDIYEVLRKAQYDYIIIDGQKQLARMTNLSDPPMHYGKEPLAKVSLVSQPEIGKKYREL